MWRRFVSWTLVRTVIFIVLYVGLFNVYLALLTISTHYAHLLYNYLTISTMIMFYFNQFSECEKTRNLNLVLGLCLVANFIMIILYWHSAIDLGKQMFYTFNGLIFAIIIMALISAARYGYFKKTSNG